MKLTVTTALLVLCLVVPPLHAGATAAGAIDLRVVSSDGSPVAGARVVVRSSDALVIREVLTRDDGRAFAPDLPPGRYRAEARDEDGAVAGEVRVRQAETSFLTLTRRPQYGQEIVVEAMRPQVDVSSATVVTHVTPEAASALPVGRDYVAFTQLALGASVPANSGGLEPSADPYSGGGNNYRDRGGNPGSHENTYALDGFNITDLASGSGLLRFDSDAIQEESVVTSAPKAEHPAGRSMVVFASTRSGGSRFSGSLSWYTQTSGMIEEVGTSDSRFGIAEEDRSDRDLTAGGPLVRNRLWAFVALQERVSSAPVALSSSASPVPATNDYRFTHRHGMVKLSARPTDHGHASVLLFENDQISTGSRDVNAVPNRTSRTDQRPRILSARYTETLGSSSLLEAYGGQFRNPTASSAQHPELGPSNTLIFTPGVFVPAYERDLGSAGSSSGVTQRSGQAGGSATWLSRDLRHVVKGGLQWTRWTDSQTNFNPWGYSLNSLAPSLGGRSLAELRELGILPQGEIDAILRALQSASSSSSFASVDGNHDGTVTLAELEAVRFTSSAGNADGVNFLRSANVRDGRNDVGASTRALFLQDDWRIEPFTVSAGIRAEKARYVASDGSVIASPDITWAPRLAAAWNVGGRGDQRLTLSFGRYIHALQTPIVHFAGNLSGSIFAEEIFLGSGWFTYRERGSATRRDAVFAPAFKDLTQDEWAASWAAAPSPRLSVTVLAYYRRDSNMIEDYDPSVYFNPTAAGNLALTPAQFGFCCATGPTNANYFVGNLVGGRRNWRGIDVAVSRPFADGWSATAQYAWQQGKGNTNSVGNTDLQGDFLELDPRQPYMYGNLPGTIDHQVKLFGSWQTPFRLEIGGLFYWSSGAHFTEADIFRPASYGIIMNHLRADGSRARTGAETQPSYQTLDLRFRYPFPALRGLRADLIADVFNAFDNQQAWLLQEGHNHPDYPTYREPRARLMPRRYQVGIRVGW